MEKFEYEIGGKKYIQKPIVWGQIRQLKNILPRIGVQALTIEGVMFALGDQLAKAIAIVLIPEGENPKDKDIDALAEEIEFSLDPETILRVIEDFFDCNPIVSLSRKLNGMILNLKGNIAAQIMTQSKEYVSSLPEETSPKETPSSGDTVQ